MILRYLEDLSILNKNNAIIDKLHKENCIEDLKDLKGSTNVLIYEISNKIIKKYLN